MWKMAIRRRPMIRSQPRHLLIWLCLLLLLSSSVLLYFYLGFELENESWIKYAGSSSKPFKILFWTPWYGSSTLGLTFGNMSLPCEDLLQTEITFNKKEYDSADVILFQLVDLPSMSQLPPKRNPSVPWILSLQETPVNHNWTHGSRFDSIFNYTWGLRDESEVHLEIKDMFEPCRVPDEDWVFGSSFSKQFMRRKTHAAAWVVSNHFVVRSKRNEFARKLYDYGVDITVFSRGGNSPTGILTLNCSQEESCFRDVGQTHKFLLAFENSLCANTMSEKLSQGLQYGMVPVFWGIFNLSHNAPLHSYIDAMDYNSTEELAQYLNYLDRDDEEYFKYFEWRQHYSVKNLKDSHPWKRSYHCMVWRKMRELRKLSLEGSRSHSHSYEDVKRWFTKFYNWRVRGYCDLCLLRNDIDENSPKATKERLLQGKNCSNEKGEKMQSR